MKKVNLHLDSVSIEDIESHKDISTDELDKDLSNLLEYLATENKNAFFGNPFLYHFQLRNLLRCKRENGKTIYDVWENKSDWEKLIESTRQRNRGGRTAAGNVFECFRANTGSIVMFKATTAKYIYKKYGATKVLDPTAGWGGRMLGAWALDIDYVGIDTNVELTSAYERMIEYLKSYHPFMTGPDLSMIWGDAMEVDFSSIDYDFVLTSPPYINLEVYEHMPLWASKEDFHKNFFIPLFEKCMDNIKKEGKVCFNISPKMYHDAIGYGLTKCDSSEDLKQQLGQQTGKKAQDKIYVWSK